MKTKIFIPFFVAIIILFVAVYFLMILPKYKESEKNVKSKVSLMTKFYKYRNDSDKLKNIRDAKEMAKKKELVDAFDAEKWFELRSYFKDKDEDDTSPAVSEEHISEEKYKEMKKKIQDTVQVELNVINKLYDESDAIFITDIDGVVVAKNLDGTLSDLDIGDKLLIKTALNGLGEQDVIKLLDKYYKTVAVPLIKEGEIVGTYCSANIMDTEMVKKSFLKEEEISDPPVFFGFLDENDILGSTMPSGLHRNFDKYIKRTSDIFDEVKNDEHKIHTYPLRIENENYFVSISIHPRLSEKKDMFYMGMVSLDKITSQIDQDLYSLIIITILLIISGIVLAFVLEYHFYNPINHFVENMIEIINGNTEYRFDNEAEGVEGMLNQNANYMISVLLGEKTPEEINKTKK